MFTGFAAVLLVTSGLAVISFDLDLPVAFVAACICVFSGACLVIGQYRWMDSIVKILLIVLFISTLTATALSVPLFEWKQTDILTPDILNRSSLLFLAALIGFMPAPFETCIWQSLWILEKDKQENLSSAEVKLDYHVGYFSTLLTAVCFLLLGAARDARVRTAVLIRCGRVFGPTDQHLYVASGPVGQAAHCHSSVRSHVVNGAGDT